MLLMAFQALNAISEHGSDLLTDAAVRRITLAVAVQASMRISAISTLQILRNTILAISGGTPSRIGNPFHNPAPELT